MDTLLNPALIIEVLSHSTESDRGIKFGHYRKVKSLVEYLLVSQHEYRIEQYVRQPDGPWLRSEGRGLNGKLELPSIQCSLEFKEIYDRINFPG